MQLSVIIPIYNTSPYLEKCVQSVLHQNIAQTDYEIILIDDGSTDHSLEICHRFANEHSNIKVLTQSNSGQSVARNRGLDIATGEYILFVDSDDFLEAHCLQTLIQKADALQLDILVFCADNLSGDKIERRQIYHNLPDNLIIKGVEFLAYPQYQNCVPFHLYRRQFIDHGKFRFMEGVFHEDNEILPRIFYSAQRISILNEVLYHVNLREGSTIRSINPKKAHDLIKVAQSLTQFMMKEVAIEHKPLICNYISLAINGSLNNFLVLKKEDLKKLSKAWYQHKALFSIMKMSDSSFYRMEGRIYSTFPRRVATIHKLLKKLIKIKQSLS